MPKKLRFVFPLLIVVVVLFSGCSNPPSKEQLLQIKEAKEFLEEYPEAEIYSNYFNESSFSALQSYAPTECKKIPKKAYWQITLKAPDAILYLYLDDALKTECAYLQSKNECEKNEDCDDKDKTTKDLCTGTPKKCVHELKKCTEQYGQTCKENEYCEKAFIKASDTNRCCPTACMILDPCIGVECRENEKCIKGKCVLKTCKELGGTICKINEYCTVDYIDSFDSERCCPWPCSEEDPCKGITCPPHLKCVRGKCVMKTCVERSGYICKENEICTFGYINASDTSRCCTGPCRKKCGTTFCPENKKCINNQCVLKTCEEMNGMECSISQECSGTLTNSADTNNCCIGTCIDVNATPTPTVSPTATPTPTTTPTPTVTVTPTPTSPTPTPTPSPSPTPTPTGECQNNEDCDDGLSYTLDECIENECSNTFIEGTNCGNMNFVGLEGSDVTAKCFSYAMLECIPAEVRILGDANFTITIIERNGDSCTFNYLIEESLTQNIPGEGLDANCVYSISYVKAEHQDGMEMLTVLYLVFLVDGLVEGQEDACSGSLIDFMSQPCSEHCTAKGFSFSKCITSSDLDTYKLCVLGEEGYIGKIKDCKIGGEQGTCCCANSEGEMLK